MLAEISVIIMRSVVIFIVGPPGLKIGCIFAILLFVSIYREMPYNIRNAFSISFYVTHFLMVFTVLCVAKKKERSENKPLKLLNLKLLIGFCIDTSMQRVILGRNNVFRQK